VVNPQYETDSSTRHRRATTLNLLLCDGVSHPRAAWDISRDTIARDHESLGIGRLKYRASLTPNTHSNRHSLMPDAMSGTHKLVRSSQTQATSNLAYDLALLLFRGIINVFFREVRPRGSFNIPREGPVIFVGAPHSNQVRLFP